MGLRTEELEDELQAQELEDMQARLDAFQEDMSGGGADSEPEPEPEAEPELEPAAEPAPAARTDDL